jgi:hypothetical protein
MNINCTVIIQICNFFLTWSLLESILLRPLLQKLIFKKKKESDFLDSIEKKKDDIEELKRIQKEQWQKLNQYCLQNMPNIKKPTVIPIYSYALFTDEIDTESVDSLATSYIPLITKWLKGAR